MRRQSLRLFDGIPGYDPRLQAGDCIFDEEKALQAIEFFERYLRHTTGAYAGRPFRLERWQKAIVANLFGWLRPDGTRRYRECFIYVGRKNGKTTLTAGMLLYVLYCDGEPGAELYSAAADRDQALIVFRTVAGMIEASPEMRRHAKLYRASKTILVGSAMYRAISADAPTKHGINAHWVNVDELHAQPNRELVDVLTTSTGARRQPIIVYTTTADYTRPSICNEVLERARAVRDNPGDPSRSGYDPSFLPVIYEASPDDDWRLVETWRKANPNLGVTISKDYLQRECEKAKNSPAYENTFKRLHLNIQTRQDVRLIQLHEWEGCGENYTPDDLFGRECWGGLDLSSKWDLTAFVLFFPGRTPEEPHRILPYFWLPEETIEERSRKGEAPYDVWAKEGFVITTPGRVIDYDRIRRTITGIGPDGRRHNTDAITDRYRLRGIAYDRWGATQIAQQLEGDGITMVSVGQGYASLSEPTKDLLAMIRGRRLRHNHHPVMDWCVSNAAAEKDAADNIKPSKKHASDRMDGVVALVMAIALWLVRKDDGRQSVYEDRDLVILDF